jgi:MipA family protein
MNHSLNAIAAAALLLTAVSPALADDDLSSRQYVLDLGAGVMYQPKYPGADEITATPFPLIAIDRFFIPGLGGVIDSDAPPKRFSVYPSFGFNGTRESSDANELKGTDDVDWALELGLGLSYRHDWFRGFVEVRQGFNGHTGQVADFGMDFIANPTEDLEVQVGPRASWGSADYMDTYFGVSAREAAAPASILDQYDADPGFNRLGVAATARYALTDRTTLHVRAGWDRLVGDAADSPIVKEGSEDQYYIGTGLSYRFGFDLTE